MKLTGTSIDSDPLPTGHAVPLWVLLSVIVSAASVGILASALIWYCFCRRADKRKELSLKRGCPVNKKNYGYQVINTSNSEKTENMEFVEKLVDKPNTRDVLQPAAPRDLDTIKNTLPSASSSKAIYLVQPPFGSFYSSSNKLHLLSTTSSTVSSEMDYPQKRNSRREERYKEDKVAKLKLAICYEDKSKELVLTICQVRSIHGSINPDKAYVEMRLERPNNEFPGRLISARLSRKGGKLMGTGQEHRFYMEPHKILGSVFNFYLWSTDHQERNYQAGLCRISFENKHLADFTHGFGFSMNGDFMISGEEDTRDSAKLSLTLRYRNRSNKLIVVVNSLENVPKLGWRSFTGGLADNTRFFEPRPQVKVILTREDNEKEPECQKTDHVKGYNPMFDKTCVFDVPLKDLKHVKITVEVSYSNLKVTHNKIGTLHFSANSTGSEGEHWREMEQNIRVDSGATKDHFLRIRR